MNACKLLSVILICLFAIACSKEDKITPSEGLEGYYELPQGTHAYDTLIMKWHEQYDFYPLYIFKDKDLYWDNVGWGEWRFMSDWDLRGGLLGKQGDEQYVGELLELFDLSLMSRFPDNLLQYMPKKLMLCSELWAASTKTIYRPDGTYEQVMERYPIWSYMSYAMLAINGANSGILAITGKDSLAFTQAVATSFASKLVYDKQLVAPKAFLEVSEPYYKDKKTPGLNSVNLFTVGLLETRVVTVTSTLEAALIADFATYVKLVLGNMFDRLNGEIEAGYDSNYPKLGGVFNRPQAANGLVRQKYDIVVEYLKECKIDVEFYQYYKGIIE